MRYIFLAAFFFISSRSFAELNIINNEGVSFGLSPYLQIDVISLKNVVGLDRRSEIDRSTYLGIDYSLGFNLNLKQSDLKLYLKLERNGPYDYDAPLFIDKTLMVSGPTMVEKYRNEKLLPQLEEFWFDLPVSRFLRLKAGLFGYEVGKGFASGTSSFENYGLSIYHSSENFSFRFHYFQPDSVYKSWLGPRIKQEQEAGIDYEPNKAHYLTFDATFSSPRNKFQPFAALLLDFTPERKRTNKFSTPTDEEALGIFGLSYDLAIKDFSFGCEIARNFGRAKSNNAAFKDVVHKGYLFYINSSYNIKDFCPHVQFLFSSGNKVTSDMVNNGDTTFTSGVNKAFSIYSPLNTNFFDSLSPVGESLPLVFCGWGYGLNYGVGINRPSTLADNGVLENLIMPGLGLDYRLSDKFKVIVDWWYIRANERGVGKLGGRAKELSRNLGQEIDITFSYDINKNINISLYGGYFSPGKYFREERDDTDGSSLFTPYLRGDGRSDGAYQIELVTIFQF